jgi:hypothetical protein
MRLRLENFDTNRFNDSIDSIRFIETFEMFERFYSLVPFERFERFERTGRPLFNEDPVGPVGTTQIAPGGGPVGGA